MAFGDIRGQGRAVVRLRRAWAAGRLPQAYCFLGPPGVGKRTTAVALAQAVNCLAPVLGPEGAPEDACGRCQACRKIVGGIHPDVSVVQPEAKTVITIDQIRELTARTGLRAYEGKVKVWILDPADLMQEPAANALLKTLEEPTGPSLFILVTAAPSALLATIRSRCQDVRFDLLGERDLREILTDHGRTVEAAAAAAALAGGSAERALALDVEQARELRNRLVAEVWGGPDSLPAILDRAERLSKDRAALQTALEILAAFSRDLTVAKAGNEVGPLDHADHRETVEKLAAAHPLAVFLEAHAAQVEAQRVLSRYASARLTAERMLFRMRSAIRGAQEDTHGSRGSG